MTPKNENDGTTILIPIAIAIFGYFVNAKYHVEDGASSREYHRETVEKMTAFEDARRSDSVVSHNNAALIQQTVAEIRNKPVFRDQSGLDDEPKVRIQEPMLEQIPAMLTVDGRLTVKRSHGRLDSSDHHIRLVNVGNAPTSTLRAEWVVDGVVLSAIRCPQVLGPDDRWPVFQIPEIFPNSALAGVVLIQFTNDLGFRGTCSTPFRLEASDGHLQVSFDPPDHSWIGPSYK